MTPSDCSGPNRPCRNQQQPATIGNSSLQISISGTPRAFLLRTRFDLSALRRHQPVCRCRDHLGAVREAMAICRRTCGQDGEYRGGDFYIDLFRSPHLVRRRHADSANVRCNGRRRRFYRRCAGRLRMEMDAGSQSSGNPSLRPAPVVSRLSCQPAAFQPRDLPCRDDRRVSAMTGPLIFSSESVPTGATAQV